MRPKFSQNEFNGRATGALFFTVFGAMWFLLGLFVREQLHAGAVITLVVLAALLVTGAVRLKQLAKRWPRVPEDPALEKAFNRVNAIQWIVAFAVAFTLGTLHRSAYIPAAIALIVGLHLFPLARVFRYPLHYATGTLLVLWSVGCMVAVPADILQGVTSLGAGTILWIAAAVSLFNSLRSARFSPASMPEAV